ncbi:MAG: TolC family protein, partial [Mariprofundaceae bacterium]|nr:TolC family protein [Mariprofundaceae bacterium]
MHVPTQVQFVLAMIFAVSSAQILTPAAVQADESALSLGHAEQLVLQQNPALAAAGKQAEAMAAIPSQAGSLPDPKLSLKSLNLPVDSFSTTAENMTQMQIGFSQAIPFPGKLALRAEAASRMAGAALENRQEFRLVLLRNTRIHWWNLAYLDKALTIVRQNQALLRNLVKIAETKYKTGRGLQQDVLLAQLELSKLLERELSLMGVREREAAALNALLGRSASAVIALPAARDGHQALADPDTAALRDWARGHRPMLLAMDYQTQAADSRLALAYKDYYPDFNLGAAYGFRQGVNPANRQSRPDFASVMLSMSLPIYSSGKQDKAVDQRMAEKARAQFSWQDAANQVDADIEASASDLRIARNQLALFEKGIIPQARLTTASMLA